MITVNLLVATDQQLGGKSRRGPVEEKSQRRKQARTRHSENSDVQQGNSDQETGQGRDPLGRLQGGDGSSGTAEARRDGQDSEAQAAELLEEIRRRAGERNRSESERDYLKRLLDLF